MTSPWTRAPWLLLRYPGLLLAMAVGGVLLGVASTSAPVFVASTGNSVLGSGLNDLCPWTVGIQINVFPPFRGQQDNVPLNTNAGLFGRQDAAVRRATAGLGGLAPAVVTMEGPTVLISNPSAPAKDAREVQMFSRDGQFQHVQVLQSSGSPGLWITDTTARELDAKVGDTLRLGLPDIEGNIRGRQPRVRVAAVYRDLATLPTQPFWCSFDGSIRPNSAFSNFRLPPLLLLDRALFLDLAGRGRDAPVGTTWEYALQPGAIPLDRARTLSTALLSLKNRANDLVSPYRLLGVTAEFGFTATQAQTDLPYIAEQVSRTVDAIRGPIQAVALAGTLVALLVLGAVGVAWVDRRRIEVGNLEARGVGPAMLGLKAMLEGVVVLVVSAGVGWAATVWLVRRVGPSSVIGDAGLASLAPVGLGCAVALVLLGLVTTMAARERAPGAGPTTARLRGLPWELILVALAGAALYEISTRGTGPIRPPTTTPPPGGAVSVAAPAPLDVLLLLFPILFVGGFTGIANRGLKLVLGRLRWAGSGRGPALFLAARRLASARGLALGLVGAVALAAGVLTYAGIVGSTVHDTGRAKAEVFIGSDLSVELLRVGPPPSAIAASATLVRRAFGANAHLLGIGQVDVLGVDSATFARAAFWDPTFASRSVDALLGEIAPSGTAGPPAGILVAGTPPAEPILVISGTQGGGGITPIRIVDTATSFPGLERSVPLLVMDQAVVRAFHLPGIDELWVRGDPVRSLAAIRKAKLPFRSTVSADEVAATPDFQVLTWAFGFLRALGIATGLVSVGGLLLYLGARQRRREAAYVLARRMGLKRRSHLLSLLIEVAGPLAAGLVLGFGLAYAAARLVAGKLDPKPKLPPTGLFRVPGGLLLATAAAAILLAVLGVWRVQRAADRARVAEILRARA